MYFYIKNKIIQLDKQSLQKKKIIGDNTEYVANFIFDEEWNGKVKTARFINNGIYKDVILNDKDSCNIPIEVMKSGIVEVGVYAGNLQTTTATCVMITPSILEKYGIPSDPTPEIYAQIIAIVENLESIETAKINDDGDLIITLVGGNKINTGRAEGVGIKSIEQTQKSTEDSGENIWTVTLTDNTKHSFSTYNGSKGKPFTFEDFTEEQLLSIKGDKGDKGDTAVIESVSVKTGEAGTQANVINKGTSSEAKFEFTIPKGDKGDTGATPNLSIGEVETLSSEEKSKANISGTPENPILNLKLVKGDTGATPNLKVGEVKTVSPDLQASATITGTSEEPELNLEIPKGDKGDTGLTPNLTIGIVKTLSPDEESKATISGTAEEPVLNLSLVKGDTGATPDISIGTVETIKPNESAEATMTGTAESPVLNLKVPQGETGLTPNLSIGTVSTVAPTESASATMTGTKEEPVLNLSIPKGSVTDGDVDFNNTTWLRKVYHNIFDKATVTNGYRFDTDITPIITDLRGGGTFDGFVSDFIPVKFGKTYIIDGCDVGGGLGAVLLRYYNENKVCILADRYKTQITIPENAAFFRFSIGNQYGTADNIYIHEDIGVPLDYKEYMGYSVISTDASYSDMLWNHVKDNVTSEEYFNMIRDINNLDLLEQARNFVDDNKGVLSDEALKSGYWSILRMAGYTNIRGQLNRETGVNNDYNLSFYPKDNAVIPKKVVFGLKPDEYFRIAGLGTTLPTEDQDIYNIRKYEGVTDFILDYDNSSTNPASTAFTMNSYPFKILCNSLKTLILDKKGSIGMWSVCKSDTLTKVVLYGKEEPFDYATFSYCPNLKSLHFPTGCADMVNSTIHGSMKLDDFTIGENYTGAIYLNGNLLATNPRITEILHKLIENLADLTSYILTTEEPSDWSTSYTRYYTESDGVYTQITDEIAPTWVENTYYSKNAGKAFVVGPTLLEKIDDEHKQMLENKNWQYS